MPISRRVDLLRKDLVGKIREILYFKHKGWLKFETGNIFILPLHLRPEHVDVIMLEVLCEILDALDSGNYKIWD